MGERETTSRRGVEAAVDGGVEPSDIRVQDLWERRALVSVCSSKAQAKVGREAKFKTRGGSGSGVREDPFLSQEQNFCIFVLVRNQLGHQASEKATRR